MAVPNLPAPVNGMIKTYDNSSRGFKRPYSAKNVFFYKEGDSYFQGIRVPVSKSRYRTMDSLLDDLTNRIPLDFGVRRVYTPTGRHEVQNVEQLSHLGKYVCSSTRWARKFDMKSVEKLHKIRQEAAEKEKHYRRVKSLEDALQASSLAAQRQKEKLKVVKITRTPPINARPKQILFVLNGTSNRVYRALIRPQTLPTFSQLLDEISEGLKEAIHSIYSFDGHKVLTVDAVLSGVRFVACRKNERPKLDVPRFPPIPRERNLTAQKHEQYRSASLNRSKPRSKKTDSPNSLPPAPPKRERSNGKSKRLKTNRTKSEPRKKRNKENTQAENVAAAKIQAGIRGYLTRKHIKDEHKAATKIQARTKGFLARKQKGRSSSLLIAYSIIEMHLQKLSSYFALALETLEGCETETATVKIQAALRSYLQWRRLAKITQYLKYLSSLDPEHTKESAITIQKNYRRYRAQNSYRKQRQLNQSLQAIDPTKMRRASVAIQAVFRGYKSRKDNQIPEELYCPWSPVPSAEVDFEKEEQAATLLQSTFRGYITRKKVTSLRTSRMDSSEASESQPKSLDNDYTYTISVFTGNRWGADFDGNLYITLYGKDGTSKVHKLEQDATDPKFLQNQVDAFDITADHVGELTKIVVGHSSSGYGAGIYLERIIVADMIDNRQYVFLCSYWLDSGQVDGKLERTLPCAEGRWNIRVHSGQDTKKNVTGAISVVGYGSFGISSLQLIGDALPAGQIIEKEVELGEIGELYKLRVESDGNGSAPDFLLDRIEMRDLDSGEEICLYCNKWLTHNFSSRDSRSKPQLFRDLPIFRIGVEPLPVMNYNITVTIATGSLVGSDLSGSVTVQLIGEYGDSGSIPVTLPKTNGSPTLTFDVNLEAVLLGRLSAVSFLIPATESGERIVEGFRALQDIYDKHNLPILPVADWVVQKAVVRESPHAPYQFIFTESKVLQSDVPGMVKKQVNLTGMEGLSTKLKETKDSKKKSKDKWKLWVTTGDHIDSGSLGIPYVILYGNKGVSKAQSLSDSGQKIAPGTTSEFQISSQGVGTIYKLRIWIDSKNDSNSSWYLKKLRMKDTVSEDELRFNVEMWLDNDAIVELPAIWPDIPPLPLLVYQVTVVTSANSSNDTAFSAFVNIHGEKGDSGKRNLKNAIGTQRASLFKPGNVDTFEIEAVTVKEISKITLSAESQSENAKWCVDNVQVLDPESGKLYTFDLKDFVTPPKGDKKKSGEKELLPTSLIAKPEQIPLN